MTYVKKLYDFKAREKKKTLVWTERFWDVQDILLCEAKVK